VSGIAFDGGQGISSVQVSFDGGQQWHLATLGKDLGRYAFRAWRIAFTPQQTGTYALKVRATNRGQETQPLEAHWNPSGYMRNGVETTHVIVV
jgi:hypothetical protein